MRATRYHQLGLDVLQDTNTFTPVDDADTEGRDVQKMQGSHNNQVYAILSRLCDKDQTERLDKLLKSPVNLKFPSMTA